MRQLSHLEYAVLGTVWRLRTCTAYQVRKRFLESPSSHWTGSAGAIYPLMRRLNDRRLLKSRGTGDARGTRQYELAAAGRRALHDWLQPPLPEADIAYTYDPIRLRLFFLDVLNPAEQRDLVGAALRGLTAREAVIEADCAERERNDDQIGYLAARGALHAVRARIVWLREVAAAIDEPHQS